MEIKWIVALSLFAISIFLFWAMTSGPMKKEYGEKMWKNWGNRLYYWQGAIYASCAITILVLFLLKWINVLNF